MVEQQFLSEMGSYTKLRRFQGNGHMVGFMLTPRDYMWCVSTLPNWIAARSNSEAGNSPTTDYASMNLSH
jgi:hypothetical protein